MRRDSLQVLGLTEYQKLPSHALPSHTLRNYAPLSHKLYLCSFRCRQACIQSSNADMTALETRSVDNQFAPPTWAVMSFLPLWKPFLSICVHLLQLPSKIFARKISRKPYQLNHSQARVCPVSISEGIDQGGSHAASKDGMASTISRVIN